MVAQECPEHLVELHDSCLPGHCGLAGTSAFIIQAPPSHGITVLVTASCCCRITAQTHMQLAATCQPEEDLLPADGHTTVTTNHCHTSAV